MRSVAPGPWMTRTSLPPTTAAPVTLGLFVSATGLAGAPLSGPQFGPQFAPHGPQPGLGVPYGKQWAGAQ